MDSDISVVVDRISGDLDTGGVGDINAMALCAIPARLNAGDRIALDQGVIAAIVVNTSDGCTDHDF